MSGRKIEGTVALVTGSNRGIGRAIVEALIERGAAKVYAAARKTEGVADLVAAHGGRVVAVELDVTNADHIAKAAALATDVSLLVNNAGVATSMGTFIIDPAVNPMARTEFEVNVFGLMNVTQAFVPALNANGGGAVVNLGSVASLVSFAMAQTYSASKAAVHSINQALRIALGNTLVVGVYPGPVDTDMAQAIPMEKATPASVAHEILDGVESGTEEVFPDPMAKEMGAFYLQNPKGLEQQAAAMAQEGA